MLSTAVEPDRIMIFTPLSSPVRDSPPRGITTAPNEKLFPDIESFTLRKQEDTSSTDQGLLGINKYEPPVGCSCSKSILDCSAHHEEAASVMSLVPRDVGGHASNVVRMGPLPGLNKYGDTPNRETRLKAARSRANRVLRGLDPERYAQEMDKKKILRDAFLQAERAAGRR
ncbi:hypothetical protein G7054_g439 [Neopestalotiopsis clavispora]|nr:hypothetical protein G7054_g439 [Neopestalotiopsis clavispora]